MSRAQQLQNNRPLHPQDLFNRLLGMNMKNLQCVCQSEKLKQQKRVLYKLLEQYSEEINKLKREDIQRQRLRTIRAQLQIESEHINRQKFQIAQYIKRDVEELKLKPVEIAEKQQWDIQMSLLRENSHKKGLKIEQLRAYIKKMQIINRKLEQQKRHSYNNENIHSNTAIEENYRNYLKRLRTQQIDFTNGLRLRIQQQEQACRRTAEEVEFEIAERNRKRYEQFELNQRKNQMLNRAHELQAMHAEQSHIELMNRSPPAIRLSRMYPYEYPRVI